MHELKAKVEALLFLSTKPILFKRLESVLRVKSKDIRDVVDVLAQEFNVPERGIHVIVSQDAVTLATNPMLAKELTEVTKDDLSSELTRPQLETLTIVAYRGPITKAEIEHIRGVNCSLILRNLLMRSLIEEHEDAVKLQNAYTLSSKMLRHLGLHNKEELPDYDALHENQKIDDLLHSLTSSEQEV